VREQKLIVSTQVELMVSQCWECRKFSAHENGHHAPCPYCTERYWRNAQDANAKRGRSISSLRGVITRLKRGRR
jgi:hypothetical protein